MKPFLLSLFLLMLLSSCKDDFTTGIEGTVLFGTGDCMPVIIEENREYEKYDGRIFFIEQSQADSLGSQAFDYLKSMSPDEKIRNGKLSKELPAGTYYVMPEEYFLTAPANTIIITADEILHQDVKIWICTSY